MNDTLVMLYGQLAKIEHDRCSFVEKYCQSLIEYKTNQPLADAQRRRKSILPQRKSVTGPLTPILGNDRK
jgi:hypothetical protein